MLKRNSQAFVILHKLIDLLIINLSWWLCYYLRFKSNLIPGEQNLFTWYFKFSILLTFLSYYYFRRENLYNSKRFSKVIQEFFSILRANSMAFTIFIVLTYFLSEHKLSRIFIFSYYFISTFFLILFKILIRKSLKHFRASGKNIRFSILIGNSKQIIEYAKKIEDHPEFGVRIQKWYKDQIDINNLKFSDLDSLKPDSIVFGNDGKNYIMYEDLLKEATKSLYEVIILPDLSHSLVGYKVVDIAGSTAFLMNEPNLRTRSMILKRLFDLFLSFIGLLFISPILLLIAIAIKISSKGPIFFSQVRMGLDGREFRMYKFRSMTTEKTNLHTWTVKDDPRVSRIGKFLRRTSLDELPQLFNVLLGDMSLVGPRPERPVFVKQFREKIPTYMLRHKMKAGMTGWAQINGWRGDTSIEKRIECDLYYIKNWSLGLDVWIVMMTFFKGFINKNGY
jgi:Undecaprenyl-phosphate glucose phosphotransferase